MNHHNFLSLSLTLLLISTSSSSSSSLEPPPLPILPLPSAPQLKWQEGEMGMFLHFGPNTFTGSEWGTGHADPSVFNPTRLDAAQWVRVAKDAGFSRVILTAKHHDGFCLWPSDFTDYSVRSSTWRLGIGDVVGELADAARLAGIGLGIYLSPWDRHERCYGRTLDYNQFYVAQITELLTKYGEIAEVFLDGAKGEGEKDMEYFFNLWFHLIHQYQPGAVIFSDAGPDTRWVGNEAGASGSTCWSTFNRSDATIGGTDPRYSKTGDPVGLDWVPAECDVSIRPGWFWHASEEPKSAKELLEIYYKSLGRNCVFLLNVPPNSSGLISPQDIRVLSEFSEIRKLIFSHNLASNALVTASSTRGNGNSHFDPHNVLEDSISTYWAPKKSGSDWVLYLDLKELVSFNVLKVREPIQMGQRIAKFWVEVRGDRDENWRRIANGTTVGYQRLLRFPRVESQFLRLVVHKSRAEPLVSYLGIYMDRFSSKNDDNDNDSVSGTRQGRHYNNSTLIHHMVVNESRISTM